MLSKKQYCSAWASGKPISVIHDYERHCMTLYNSILPHITVYDYVYLCLSVFDYVWLCMTLYDYIWLCMIMYYNCMSRIELIKISIIKYQYSLCSWNMKIFYFCLQTVYTAPITIIIQELGSSYYIILCDKYQSWDVRKCHHLGQAVWVELAMVQKSTINININYQCVLSSWES